MEEKLGAVSWKIEKIVSKGDYDYAVVKGHPKATKYGYILHHRIVMENHLGRLLNEMKKYIQLNRRTTNVETAISGNLVREFYSTENPEQTA